MEDKLSFECPKCKEKLEVEISKLRPGNVVRCPHCSVEIEFSGDDIPAELEKLMENLRKYLK